ncbi:MAG TPA: hypothetical protein VFF73_22480, partial [Planctomycetota bacterium]|nr:hypothetical protein [Planctomycetota bacterium]
ERARLAAESDAPFTAAKGDAARLLAVTKDVLRWRSLESFWGKVQARPEEERARLFAEDYVEREEVRAACEAYYLDRIRQKTTDRPVGKPLVELEEKTYLAAILLGEPLGQVATVAGLASEWSQKRGSPDPVVDARLRAAATVTLALVKALAPATPPAASEDGDVRDCARLARARPDELTKAARAVLDQLN